MDSFRNNITRRNRSISGSNVEQDFILQSGFQPELNQNNMKTIFSKQLGKQASPNRQDDQTARQQLREYINFKKANANIQKSKFESKQLESAKTQILYPKFKTPTPYNSKHQSLQLQKQNNLNSFNMSSTLRKVNQIQEIKEAQKFIERERLINLQLKQENQNLRTQIYQLRNVQIELQQIKIYVRKLQNQITDHCLIINQIKSQNQILVKGFDELQMQLASKIHKSELLSIQLIQANKKIQQLNQANFQNQQVLILQKQKTETQMKNLENQSYQKSTQLTELYRQNQSISQLLEELKKQNAEIHANYEDCLKVIELMEDKIGQLNSQSTETQKIWESEVKRHDLLFKQMEKVVEQKCRQTSLLTIEYNKVKEQLEKCQITSKEEAVILISQIDRLKDEVNLLNADQQKVKIIKQKSASEDIDITNRAYVPKKWFEQKINYEYTINALQNQLQALIQAQTKPAIQAIQSGQSPKQQLVSIVISQAKKKSNQKHSVKTQTEQINLDQISLEKSKKTQLIDQKELRIFSLEKQIEQIKSSIENQKHTLQGKYKTQLMEQEQKYQTLQKQYQQEKQLLNKEKQRNEDLTMEVLLLNKDLKQSLIKVRSKQYL